MRNNVYVHSASTFNSILHFAKNWLHCGATYNVFRGVLLSQYHIWLKNNTSYFYYETTYLDISIQEYEYTKKKNEKNHTTTSWWVFKKKERGKDLQWFQCVYNFIVVAHAEVYNRESTFKEGLTII